MRFSLVLPRREEVRVSMHDIRGRRVATVAEGVVGPGVLPLVLDARALPSGRYLLRLRSKTGGEEDSAAITLIH
jgi:hypothetical protein